MIDMDKVYIPAPEIVSREIEGEILIIPISADVADMEEDIFTLNNTGRSIWDKLDGKNTPRRIVDLLLAEYEDSQNDLVDDISGFLEALLDRKLIIET